MSDHTHRPHGNNYRLFHLLVYSLGFFSTPLIGLPLLRLDVIVGVACDAVEGVAIAERGGILGRTSGAAVDDDILLSR